MSNADQRELEIHRITDKLKRFWILNGGEFSEVLNIVLDTGEYTFTDQSFDGKLTFELEQLTGEEID